MRTIAEIMRREVMTLSTRTPADEAWAAMRDEGVRHAIVTSRGTLVGVVSDRDLGGPRSGAGRRSRTVAELMTREVVTTTPQSTVASAARQMREARIGCLPVLSGGRVVGVVTTSDLIALLEVPPFLEGTAPGRCVERPRPPRATSPNIDKHL